MVRRARGLLFTKRSQAEVVPHMLRLLLRRGVCSSAPRVVTSSVEVPADKVYPPFARYAHAATVPADAKLIFTSGQLGISPDGTVGPTAEAQAAVCFDNVAKILDEAGAGVEHIVRLVSAAAPL